MIRFFGAVMLVFITMALLTPTQSWGAHPYPVPYFLTVIDIDVEGNGELSTEIEVTAYWTEAECEKVGYAMVEYLEAASDMKGIVVCIHAANSAEFSWQINRILAEVAEKFIPGQPA